MSCLTSLTKLLVLFNLLSKAEERHKEVLGHLLYVAKLVAVQEGLEEGYRVVINDGPNGCECVLAFAIFVCSQNGHRFLMWRLCLMKQVFVQVNPCTICTFISLEGG